MKREVKDLAHSVQDRLRNQGRANGLPFDWMLQYYANERFLYRLSESEHCKNFVLKGGLIFVGWRIPLRRHTIDIDFRAFSSNDLESVVQVIKEICIQPVEDDAMEFDPNTIRADVITPTAEYPGVRVRFLGKLGKSTKVPMQVDLGFSDEISPHPIKMSYPTLLDMPAPKLRGYPKESVVAEKIHCIVIRGNINSRVKDFYDLWFICGQFDFEGAILQKAIVQTFSNRDTDVPESLPEALSEEYVRSNERSWRSFLSTFNPEELEIVDFPQVVYCIKEFLFPVLKMTAMGATFDYHWFASKGQWEQKEIGN